MKFANWKLTIILISALIVFLAAFYVLDNRDLAHARIEQLRNGDFAGFLRGVDGTEHEEAAEPSAGDPETGMQDPADGSDEAAVSVKKEPVHIGYRRIPQDAQEADISYINVKKLNIDMEEVFDQLPQLEKITMIGCGLSNEEYAALQDSHPQIRIVWEIRLSHWTIRTDAVAFSTNKTTGDSFYMYNDEAYYLKYCTDLVALDLGHNRVTDLSFLQYMPELRVLILVDNAAYVGSDGVHYISDLSMLQYVPKLRYLEVFANSIQDFSFMQYLPDIENLNISYNSVYSVEYFLHMERLKRFWLENTNISYYDYLLLQQRYPYAEIVYFGSGSVDQGWREGVYYEAMRDMFKHNYFHKIFQ